MAEQLPNNSFQPEHRAPQGRIDDPTAMSHLDHLLPPTTANKNLVVSLIESVRELINPPKLPPLEVTSKPIEFVDTRGMYAGN